MTRRLPWKRVGESASFTPKPAKPTPIQKPKVKRDDIDDDRDLTPSSTSTKPVKTSNPTFGSTTPGRKARPGSTSPLPEPLPESYMIEGLEHDDRFRMVEDEFLSTAQQYTAHLHAAEYHRLKAASKLQNADTIRDISRPVVGRATDLVKIKQERKARQQKQKMAARKAAASKSHSHDDTDTESDDDQHSTTLHGLMESPRKRAARLDTLTKVVISTTRAAAGFDGVKSRLQSSTVSRSRPEKTSNFSLVAKPTGKKTSETEEDDNDLDRPAPTMRAESQPTHNLARGNFQARQPKKESYSTKPQGQPETMNSTNSSNSSNDLGGDFLSRVKERQEERQRNRERRKAVARKAQSTEVPDDIIPGFL
ncbi:hypothetical protein GGR53DRAFT_263862 [Hypoxylon sp. FL1150]|nr:hypothetical protein GGR53DRAFT_263862 [Hypoxylon sp. FL1150]